MKDPAVKLAERVEYWQKKLAPLGVSHFRVNRVWLVEKTPGGEGAAASMQAAARYDDVQFWFTYSWLENSSAQERDETIIHEWLHVAMRDFDNSLYAVAPWMPEATYRDFEETVDHEREGLVGRLSKMIYEASVKK